MADKSKIPLGQGVYVQDHGPNAPDLKSLLDANEATYGIASGTAPHLLFVRAVNQSGGEWKFTLESIMLSQLTVYQYGSADYDPPRIVDSTQAVVRQDVGDGVVPPYFEHMIDPDTESQGPRSFTVGTVMMGDGGTADIKLELEPRLYMTILEEIGTHIIPIAYHHIEGGELKIEQVQHGDIEFWPVPRHAVWSKSLKIKDFTFADTSLPPE